MALAVALEFAINPRRRCWYCCCRGGAPLEAAAGVVLVNTDFLEPVAAGVVVGTAAAAAAAELEVEQQQTPLVPALVGLVGSTEFESDAGGWHQYSQLKTAVVVEAPAVHTAVAAAPVGMPLVAVDCSEVAAAAATVALLAKPLAAAGIDSCLVSLAMLVEVNIAPLQPGVVPAVLVTEAAAAVAFLWWCLLH